LLFLISPVWKQGTTNRATSLFLLVVEGRLNEGKYMPCFATHADGRRNAGGWNTPLLPLLHHNWKS